VNQVERLQRERPDAAAFARGYLDYVRHVLDSLDVDAIAAFARALLAARDRSAHIFFIGNGGSAATASHFANDVAIGCRSWEKPFRAMSLNDNVAIMTALANDYGYEEIFVRQLQTLMRPGDVVVAISASGNSPNIVKAIEYANAHEGVTIGLTAFDGGSLKRLSQINVHVPTETGEYGPAEDGHMILDHLIGAYLMQACRTAACG
jgi:D-sedoheptulose 7-phosphate isomerase